MNFYQILILIKFIIKFERVITTKSFKCQNVKYPNITKTNERKYFLILNSISHFLRRIYRIECFFGVPEKKRKYSHLSTRNQGLEKHVIHSVVSHQNDFIT